MLERVEPEKKQRVAVLAAVKRVVARQPPLDAWSWTDCDAAGRGFVFYKPTSLQSYALARLKAVSDGNLMSDDELMAELKPGGKHHEFVVEGGTWRRHWEMRVAESKGEIDTQRYHELQKEQKRDDARWGL
jgi:hypothetical protein